jgi:hypothetical protein
VYVWFSKMKFNFQMRALFLILFEIDFGLVAESRRFFFSYGLESRRY